MYKKTISFTDYDDNPRKEDFFFNINKAELINMETSIEGGFKKYLEKIVQTQNTMEISRILRDIIRASYGEKSLDGRRFVKSSELSDAFEQTEAYSELIMEFLENPDSLAAFINGILPSDLMNSISKEDIVAKTNELYGNVVDIKSETVN